MYSVPAQSRLRKQLGAPGAALLEHALNALERLLPHVNVDQWHVTEGAGKTRARFSDTTKRTLSLELSLDVPKRGSTWTITAKLERLRVPTGVGASVSRTISERERRLALGVLETASQAIGAGVGDDSATADAVKSTFDERVVAAHLQSFHSLDVDLGSWFSALRGLAGQTYENKALAFGCLVDGEDRTVAATEAAFPSDFLAKKKYRALSDGYKTAYSVSARGAVRQFLRLTDGRHVPRKYFPEWCSEIATRSSGSKLGVSLTRQGDILVFDSGQLTFTHRFGRWQYWNHPHIVDLLSNAARAQHVKPERIGAVARSIYRAALDVSFRRSGALFVLLRNQQHIRKLIRLGDAIDDERRAMIDRAFDKAVEDTAIQSRPRAVVAELASLDGAIVLGNSGKILSYGAVLDPKKKGKIRGTEGSRSKAAIGASNYGLAVKVSSDGDITVYHLGIQLLRV